VSLKELLPLDARRAVERVQAEVRANVAKWPEHLSRMPKATWPPGFPAGVSEVWRSRELIVQVYPEAQPGVICRLSIAGTTLDDTLEYTTEFTWEQLQRIKATVGYGTFDAVEIYPADEDAVNIANMRHLWVMARPVEFAWRRRDTGIGMRVW
jgi:hypothetical protein